MAFVTHNVGMRCVYPPPALIFEFLSFFIYCSISFGVLKVSDGGLWIKKMVDHSEYMTDEQELMSELVHEIPYTD
jgi:hypothetical protein